MIVLDANVLIATWGSPDLHTTAALEILDTEDDLILHPVTLAEALVGPVRTGEHAEALADFARLGVERHTPLPDEPVRVAQLRATTRLKLPDA